MIEKIIDILDKYDKELWYSEIMENIENDIENISDQLRKIQKELSQKLYKINLSNQVKNDDICNNLLNDINDIKHLKLYFKQLKKDNNRKEIVFNENIIIYVINENLCPFCNVKLSNHTINYEKYIDLNIEKNNFSGYKCPCCNKYFAMQFDINNINFKYTNITFNYQYYTCDEQLNIYDIIVLSTLKSCNIKGHILEDITAKVPVFTENGSIDFINLNVIYCKNCNKYILLKSDFKQIKDVVACKVIDQTITINNNQNKDEIELKQYESILYQYGYNVSEKNNLSDKQRHLILASIVESNILTREQVCSHLDTLIERGK